MESCPFCRIIRGEDHDAIVLFEDDLVIAIAPLQPATAGHALVIPKQHTARLWELSDIDAMALTRATLRLADAIRRRLEPDGLNIVQSNGAAATQTVDHVHVHVVPRWRGDRMGLRWPRRAAQSRVEQRLSAEVVAASIRPALQERPVLNAPEDRRQHLGFVQSVISRMATASASAKTWLLPIVTAAYGYAFVQRDPWVAVFGALAVGLFGLLDANYLKQERAFRKLYDEIARGDSVPAFSMIPTAAGPDGPTKVNYWPDRKDWTSWAIAPFYLPLIGVGVLLSVYLGIAYFTAGG